MPALQVRDFPEELYEQLKEAARREHRSIAQQTIHLVDCGLNRKIRTTSGEPGETEEEIQARIRRRKKLFAEIAASEPIIVEEGFPSAVEIIREMRDSR